MKLRHRDPMEMARRRVRRGVQWLNRYAPPGWERRMFRITSDGRAVVRARSCRDNECHLALSFELERDLVNPYGYVTFAAVRRVYPMRGKRAVALGFDPDHTFDPVGEVLDAAWQEALFSYALPSNNPHQFSVLCRTEDEEPGEFEFLSWIQPPRWFKRLLFGG